MKEQGTDRLEDVFHRALDLEPEERARYLAEVCASNPELGAEVESLIAAHGESGNLVDSPAFEAAATLILEAQAGKVVGASIHHYHVLELLGRGGMGEVYRARDTKLNREVALKILPEAVVSGADRLERFEREAQMLASLNHPNIAVIYDLLEFEGKQVLVLELVEGATLADHLKRGALTLPTALRMSLQIAEALQAAHKKGIIHRDLKPANIMITPEGQVKVLDFGLAKQFLNAGEEPGSQAATQAPPMTITGVIMGTPGYMSPEQAAGEPMDARSDIFLFGAVLYEMLTGRRAFPGHSITALLRAVLSRDPVSPKRLRREIPLDLDASVMKALRKDRAERHQSMEELCSELSQLSARLTQQSLRLAPSTIERLRDVTWQLQAWPVETKRKAMVAATLAVLLLLAAVGWRVLKRLPERSAAEPVASERVNAEASPYELLQQGLALLERFDREGNIDAAFQAFNTALKKDPNYAPTYAGLGLAYGAQFQFNRDRSLLDHAVQNAKKAVALDGHVAINRVSLGRAYVDRGDYDLAQSESEEALILDPLNADAHRVLADLRQAKGNGAEAERLYKRAIELRPTDWRLPYALGIFYYRLSRFGEAEKAFQEAIGLAPDCYMVHRDLGAVYHIQGRFADASSEFQTALQIRPSASTYSNLGVSLFFQGLYSESVAAMEKAVELGANNYQTWANLGDAYRQTNGNEVKAGEAFQAAIRLVNGELSGNPKDGALRSQLALYLAKGGGRQEALEEAGRAEKLDQSPQVLANLVLVYEICGQREQALNALARALKQGHPLEEIKRDPELLEMRRDPRYHKVVVKTSDQIQH